MKLKTYGRSWAIGKESLIRDQVSDRRHTRRLAESSSSIQPEGVPRQDSVTGGKDEPIERKHGVLGVIGRVLGFLSMMVSIAMSLMGLRYYAMMLNVVVFGTGTVLLDIPKRVYGVKSRLIRFFDFFWFTALYCIMLILNLIMQEPDQFATFMAELFDVFDIYEAGLITFEQLLLTVGLVMGFLLMLLMGILSFFILFFFLYGRKLRETEHSRGDVIIVYFALSSFVIFLGLGGTNLVNYVVAAVLLKDLLMHKRGFRYLIRKSSESKKTVWDSLLKVAGTPRLGYYTIHLFLWGITSAVFLAYFNPLSPQYIVYSLASFGLFALSYLFIVHVTPMKHSIPVYAMVVFVIVLIATRISCAQILIGVLQSVNDSFYYFSIAFGSTTAIRSESLSFYVALASSLGLSLDAYMLSFLAHGLISTCCAGFVVYGCMMVSHSSKGKLLDSLKARRGWAIVSAALMLEPVVWFLLMSFLGMMSPEMQATSLGRVQLHIIATAATVLFLALPFGLEARAVTRRGKPIASVGTNRYLLLVVLALVVLIFADTAGVIEMTGAIAINTFLFLFALSFVFIWLPVACKIR